MSATTLATTGEKSYQLEIPPSDTPGTHRYTFSFAYKGKNKSIIATLDIVEVIPIYVQISNRPNHQMMVPDWLMTSHVTVASVAGTDDLDFYTHFTQSVHIFLQYN